MSTYTLRKANPANTRVDVLVVGIHRAEDTVEVSPAGEAVAEAYGRKFVPMLRALGFKGASGEVARIPSAGTVRASQVLFVGLGKAEELDAEQVRRAAGTAARHVDNAASVALALPLETVELLQAAVEGFIGGSYTFTGYRSSPEDSAVSEVVLLTELARRQEATAALDRGQVLATLVAQVRDWVNTPPNDLSPADFAEAAVALGGRKAAGSREVSADVLEVEDLEELGCGGILGVGQGSAQPPRLVRLSYRPKSPVATIALVGKGITFDSGGLTIKPGNSMATMKMDMAGAAAVIAATHAIAALELPVEVTAYAAMAENMPSGTAIRPGDVLRLHGGKTVEVTNTDAEGRLVLADALAMAAATTPDAIIDVATLTGACVVALGERVAGVFGDEALSTQILEASERAGESMWPLPITDQMREYVTTESRIADVAQHRWDRSGSALFAAAFLEQFTEEVPWVHLDIAGPAYNNAGAFGYQTKGGTGFAVRTLVEYARSLAEAR